MADPSTSVQQPSKKRFSFVSVHSPSSTISTPAQDRPRRVSLFHRKPAPPPEAPPLPPPNQEEATRIQQAQESSQEHVLLLPTQILKNPSLLTRLPPPLNSKMSQQEHHHTHHQKAYNLPPLSATSTGATRNTSDNYAPLDAFTLLNKVAEMMESAHHGTFPSNRKMLKLIKMTRTWISMLEEEEVKKQSGVTVSEDGDPTCSSDGRRLVECFKQSMTRTEAFLTIKNEGELIQNMIINLQIAVDKENEFLEETTGHAQGSDQQRGLKDDVVQAFKDLIKILSQIMTNKGATSLMVRVVQVVRDSMLGPSQNTGKVTKPVIAKTQDTAAATEPFSSTASSARDDGDDKIDGAKETAFDNPKLPSKTAAAQPDQTLPSTPANDPSATNGPASSIPVPHDVLGDIIQILTSHFLPANLFKSKRTTAPVSSTNTPYTASPPHQSPLAKALTEIETRTHNENVSPTDTSNNDPESARAGGEVETWSHAPPARDPESPLSGSPSSLENKESSGAETDDAAATDLVNILRAIWSNEKDSESLQAREQMVKLLESVEVLYMFGEHFLDDEETPGRGNLEIALDLGLKFIQRFIDEPIGPLKTHLSQVLPLFAINVLPKHGPCILNTLQCLQDAFSSPNLALNHPEKLHALASDFRAMVATLYEIPLPQSENKNQFLSNDSVGHEIELVSEWVYAVWEHVEKDDFVLGLSKDGAEWWNALFVDEKGAVAVKISLWRDFTKLVLPSLLVDFKTLTIPHLSYFDETIRFELENVVVDVEATLPNLCQLKVENGVLFGFNNDVDVEYTHGVAIKFFQIHLQMIEIPFKAHRSGFMKMSDEGLMDVTITNRGISVSVQLEIDSATDNPKTMVVNTVNVDIQDMQLKIYGTKNDTAYHALEATIAARVAEALKESIQMELKAVIEKWDGPMTKVKRMYAV